MRERKETSDTVLGTEDGPVPPFLRFSIKKFTSTKVGEMNSPAIHSHSRFARSAQHY